MDINQVESFLERCKGSEASYPFGPEARVYKVMGKMFALLAEGDSPQRITLKAKPADVEVLVEEFEAIIPGYYMNKRHWVTISLVDEIGESMLQDLIENSYQLVVKGLTKAAKQELADQA
ncbi:MmcQ/YjbR family DNA-binding protein [Vibrio sp. SCSIO 43136]|uniref:MmcQ/YjbR family DNA-binding protein n=1 Tax=Vibrio sp. SCSIO 43136 TaxID=2819101 RepID=UPI002075049F|nr:MmcQ/YjbR family DNA-binding protein [Vibrio sp. SCSIO 43136]USD67533.1 MmcQ/YjbR family DNA-binding protein [Vibrio sp. SCSIO 43136]